METKELLYAFNRGIMSPLGLARFDLKRLALSSSLQTNWMCRTLGSMMLRPGLAYIDSTYNNTKAVHIPFIFSVKDTAIIELTNNLMRVRVAEQIISRPAITTTMVALSSFTTASDVGGTASWDGTYMELYGNGTARGLCYDQVTVSGGNIGVEHALRIVVQKGYVNLRVGTSLGDDSYIASTTLNPGVHSLALTPTGNFYVQLSSATVYKTLVTSVALESSDPMTLPTLWPTAMLPSLRWDESADVVFVTSDGTVKQQRIERRATRSWSVVDYLADNGPFMNYNIDTTTNLTPSALTGDITLSSNIPFFKAGMVGQLFRLQSQSGQEVSAAVSGNAQWSAPIEVTGIQANGGRNLTINISGTWTGTIILQYSVGSPGAWVNSGQSWTTNQTNLTYNDGFDNQVIYYRIGFLSGYSSGTANVDLKFAVAGTTAGICRIDGFTNNTTVTAHVLVAMSGTTATTQWAQGIWSSINGYPTACGFYEGRFWQMGQDYIMGSVSDAYASYDDTVVGDSGPIIRTIAQGPVSIIQWMLGLQRLLVGCDGAEQSVRSSSLDEPLTPTNFNIKSPSTRGSAGVAAIKIDTNGIFVQRGDPTTSNSNGTRLIQITYQGVYAVVDYTTSDISEFCPELLAIGITKLAVQRKIDTRIHCLLTDGTVAVCVYDPLENEKAFVLVETQGTVEDIFVMPGGVEDIVYYVVNRTINGQTVRYLEKWAMESECVGGTINKNMDSHVIITNGSPSTAVSVPSLAAAAVCIWYDGKDLDQTQAGGVTVTLDGSGNYTLPVAANNVIVGLPYVAQFESVTLPQTVRDGTSLGCAKNIDKIGVLLSNTHYQGLQYGRDFTHLSSLPLAPDGFPIAANTIYTSYDKDPVSFDGTWNPDSRLCLQAQSPRPCTVLAANIGVDASEN